MAHSSSTPNYNLPQFATTDKPGWLTDINGAFLAIDTGLDAAKDAADNAQSDATQALGDSSTALSTANGASAKADGAIASIAESFETTNTYAVGDLVIYNSLLYRCFEAVTVPGTWTGSSNWTRVDVDALIANLQSQVNTNASNISTLSNLITSSFSARPGISIGSKNFVVKQGRWCYILLVVTCTQDIPAGTDIVYCNDINFGSGAYIEARIEASGNLLDLEADGHDIATALINLPSGTVLRIGTTIFI